MSPLTNLYFLKKNKIPLLVEVLSTVPKKSKKTSLKLEKRFLLPENLRKKLLLEKIQFFPQTMALIRRIVPKHLSWLS